MYLFLLQVSLLCTEDTRSVSKYFNTGFGRTEFQWHKFSENLPFYLC